MPLPQHGPGKAHRPIRLQPWQQALVNQATEDFVRGLIDNDGCQVVSNDRGVRSVRPYHFTNHSEDILGFVPQRAGPPGHPVDPQQSIHDRRLPQGRHRTHGRIRRPQDDAQTTAHMSLDSSRTAADRYRQGATTRRRKWPMIILVIVAACGCLALGWWQWTRYESASGTFRTSGTPCSGRSSPASVCTPTASSSRYEQAPPSPRSATEATEIPDGLLPERAGKSTASPQDDDPALREYNAYLAELARSDGLESHDRPDRTTR